MKPTPPFYIYMVLIVATKVEHCSELDFHHRDFKHFLWGQFMLSPDFFILRFRYLQCPGYRNLVNCEYHKLISAVAVKFFYISIIIVSKNFSIFFIRSKNIILGFCSKREMFLMLLLHIWKHKDSKNRPNVQRVWKKIH